MILDDGGIEAIDHQFEALSTKELHDKAHMIGSMLCSCGLKIEVHEVYPPLQGCGPVHEHQMYMEAMRLLSDRTTEPGLTVPPDIEPPASSTPAVAEAASTDVLTLPGPGLPVIPPPHAA
jgi:hypothetical protein